MRLDSHRFVPRLYRTCLCGGAWRTSRSTVPRSSGFLLSSEQQPQDDPEQDREGRQEHGDFIPDGSAGIVAHTQSRG
jgi:hypothetical protein